MVVRRKTTGTPAPMTKPRDFSCFHLDATPAPDRPASFALRSRPSKAGRFSRHCMSARTVPSRARSTPPSRAIPSLSPPGRTTRTWSSARRSPCWAPGGRQPDHGAPDEPGQRVDRQRQYRGPVDLERSDRRVFAERPRVAERPRARPPGRLREPARHDHQQHHPPGGTTGGGVDRRRSHDREQQRDRGSGPLGHQRRRHEIRLPQ